MTIKLRADIQRYIDHFRDQHAKLATLNQRLHRKVCVVTMLDALARGRYPDARYPKLGNASRFINLIEEHSSWPHATSVSRSELSMIINERGGPAACGVSDEFVKLLADAKRKPWRHEGLDDDPKPNDLLPTRPNRQEMKLVSQAKHSSLLYEYRCVLVHEYREPGHGFEFNEDDTTPFYHSMSDSKGRNNTIELVYPTRWFMELVPPVLDSLAALYVKEKYNPYDSYKFGSPWRKK